jgi:dienelactone hydrolase
VALVSIRAQGSSFAAVARKTFADLLKIPVTDPDVSVTVQSVKEEDGLIIEDIFWTSLDSERPIAYVIRPVKAGGRLPAIIYLHGSSGSRESECTKSFGVGQWTNATRRTSTRLLGVARELARRGYLTLAPTQRGCDVRSPSSEDQAKDLLIRGRNLIGADVYEIRQAVTYLQLRKDVDPKKIGMGGLSLGGINTFCSWLVDLRIAAAAPICGMVGSFDVFSRIGKRSYHGLHNWIPDILTKGDQGDFAATMAPRPLMLWAPLDDIAMPKEGVDRFIEIVRPAYERAGARDALVVYQRPGIHDLTLEGFELMNQFFDMYLKK